MNKRERTNNERMEETRIEKLRSKNTFTRIALPVGTPAGDGYKWVCNSCLGDERNDIDDRPPTPTIGDVITTPYQKCGRCGHQTWIRVPGDFVCPPYNPNPEVSMS